MENKKETKKEEKKYYDVKVEVLVPATFKYRVFASSPEEAYELTKKMKPTNVEFFHSRKRNLKVKIFDFGTSIIRYVRNLL